MLTSLKIDHRIAEHCHERLRLLWRTFPRVQESANDTFTQLFVSTLENCAQFLQSRLRNIHDSCKQLVFRAEELHHHGYVNARIGCHSPDGSRGKSITGKTCTGGIKD